MCELHYVRNLTTNRLDQHELAFMHHCLTRGANANHDGSGVFSATTFSKWAKRYSPRLSRSWQTKPQDRFLVGHNRLATHGTKALINTQPIVLSHCIVAHNGIFQDFSDPKNEYSDTYHFATSLNALLKAGRTPKKALRHILQRTFGSYSLFLYIKTPGTLYYIKSKLASFTFALLRTPTGEYWHVGSTRTAPLDSWATTRKYGFVVPSPYALISTFDPADNVLYRLDGDGLTNHGPCEPRTPPPPTYRFADFRRYNYPNYLDYAPLTR